MIPIKSIYLIKKYDFQGRQIPRQNVHDLKLRRKRADLDCSAILRGLLALNIAVLCGFMLNQALNLMGLKLPLFVTCLFVGIILANTIPIFQKNLPWPSDTPFLKMISELSLNLNE